jgi:hypothetical protein
MDRSDSNETVTLVRESLSIGAEVGVGSCMVESHIRLCATNAANALELSLRGVYFHQ